MQIEDLIKSLPQDESYQLPISNKTLRRAIYDVFGGIDFYSKRPISFEDMVIDHVIPQSLGGPDHIFNYVPSTQDINGKKSNKVDIEGLVPLLYIIKIHFAPKVVKRFNSLSRSKQQTKKEPKQIKQQPEPQRYIDFKEPKTIEQQRAYRQEVVEYIKGQIDQIKSCYLGPGGKDLTLNVTDQFQFSTEMYYRSVGYIGFRTPGLVFTKIFEKHSLSFQSSNHQDMIDAIYPFVKEKEYTVNWEEEFPIKTDSQKVSDVMSGILNGLEHDEKSLIDEWNKKQKEYKEIAEKYGYQHRIPVIENWFEKYEEMREQKREKEWNEYLELVETTKKLIKANELILEHRSRS